MLAFVVLDDQCKQIEPIRLLCAGLRLIFEVSLDLSDEASGVMLEQPDGAGQFESVTLRPHARLARGADEQKAHALHHEAAKMCFIARSVSFRADHEPTFEIEA